MYQSYIYIYTNLSYIVCIQLVAVELGPVQGLSAQTPPGTKVTGTYHLEYSG